MSSEANGARPATVGLLAAVTAVGLDLLVRPRLGPVLAPVSALLAALGAGLFVLLPPLEARQAPLRGLFSVAVLTALLAGLLQWVLGPPLAAAAIVLGAALTALLLFCTGALVLLAPPPWRRAAHGLALGALLVLALTPVWLAGWLDALSRWSSAIDALIALNPLTALAVAGQTDYLRMDWFYRHSPLGSLRFDYPRPMLLLVGYSLLALALGLALFRRRHRQPPLNRS
ncbi:hypothetical protein [Halochromatium glycolicum]|uniref:Uncharacterized protein n=1 Tax=Halochromatium glycolicum TaxID=85075 RepID=A0AAJ0X8E7_9GAMM|nr:hypothetical protein [Halochromatium glycolicum]MBK1702993.1 hypothetical protein [Halochromatium glycolicum]